jgi:flagellar motility protein MotE (MotC chaperone)
MEYEYLLSLRKHPAWRLLTADSAPLIISFFHAAFIQANRRAITAGELAARLDDHLHQLREAYGDDCFPRKPGDYLDAWAAGEQAFLRKYYPEKSDEAEYDLTPASEKVIGWLASLEQKRFVGTESRLLTIFRLLRDLVRDASTDPDEQISELERRREAIEAEIARLRRGQVRPPDNTRTRERFLEAEDTYRRLLSDFRQIEENFRQLDRKTRAHIATSDQPKGELLDEIFGEEDAIRDSDQGRSFRAFWSYLMSAASQEELDRLLKQVLALPEIREMSPDKGLGRIRFNLLEAGAKVNETCALLVEQLRRFLDDKAWLENRRIMTIVRHIEKKAVAVRQQPPAENDFSLINHIRPEIDLPMARGLFRPSRRPLVDDRPEEGAADFDTPALYDQHFVDEGLLVERIRKALRSRSQISLEQLCEIYPIEKGLSEVIAYLHLASKDDAGLVDPDTTRPLAWTDPDGRRRIAHMPMVIFTG